MKNNSTGDLSPALICSSCKMQWSLIYKNKTSAEQFREPRFTIELQTIYICKWRGGNEIIFLTRV